ncbi:Succinylglutamate desuccinylase / Aspartoacylase family protein [Ectothiorhodospira magna]|uniref:Succinylglutamate desuccinylase / Aspartoacylase family protein n=1 Tax=Ectothiorhodospira magna TaxID=867345 RepID=A0A1H9BDJ4_9GAMM|nr:succinylglutamate desuccinylase/aspartoacylase family protein [Ectothiorhodospira magna]SEP86955.1 Succinylglutamate desuccinylase / Aspartoacylase family protein [Ectothiorhodospira magna]
MSHHPTLIRSITYHGLNSGVRLIVLGAVHGNETCGTLGIERVMAALDSGELILNRGLVTFVPIANPLAFSRRQRMGERNLNRNFRISDPPVDFEDHLANRLGPLLARHDVLLDLHSFHTPGEPFVMLGPPNNTGELEPFTQAAEEEALARRLGARRIVEGWLETYALGVARRLRHPNPDLRAQMLGTDPGYGIGTTEFMRAQGGYALTLECGQHEAPDAPHVAHQAILNTLAHLHLVDSLPLPAPVSHPQVLKLVDVIDRNHPQDHFSRDWTSFDPIHTGDEIGRRHDGTPVLAPADGFIVFPNPNALPGNEWFYRAEPSFRLAPSN